MYMYKTITVIKRKDNYKYKNKSNEKGKRKK